MSKNNKSGEWRVESGEVPDPRFPIPDKRNKAQ